MLSLRDVKDECSKCERLLECELCKEGHGIRQERRNVVEMVRCQFKHMEKSGGGSGNVQSNL